MWAMPSKEFELVVGTGVHVPIWPTTNVVCHHSYRSMRLEGRIPPEALESFSDLLAVALHGQMGDSERLWSWSEENRRQASRSCAVV